MTSPTVYDEREVLRRISHGDREAFKIIYDRYWNTIYATALGYLKSPQWAEDLVQDIFLKLWIKKEKLTEVEKFDGFFFIMARNEILDALNKKIQSIPIDERYSDYLASDILSPEAGMAAAQYEELLKKAIEQLPEQQKKIFKLTRGEGLSHDEISRQLGIARRTVSNHMTKALNTIRQYLKEQGPGIIIIVILTAIASALLLLQKF